MALAGRKLPRGRLLLDHEKAIDAIADFATQVSGVDLLRVYWYDGTSTGPSSQHITLAHLAHVKVRLGFVNSVGEQKGVDSLIVTDMIALARNHVMSEAVLCWATRICVLGCNRHRSLASALAREIPTAELEALTESIRQSGQIPREFDGRLLAEGGHPLKVRLDPAQKKEVRNAFLKACERHLVEAQQAADVPAAEPECGPGGPS